MSDKMWRGGMVGAGAWSGVQLKGWSAVKNANIVALYDRHPEKRRAVAENFGIQQQFNDLETMLKEAEIDFVDICVRPYSHAALTKEAADHGYPVLCQKPFCTSTEEAREVVEYCKKTGVRLMINENFRWRGYYRKVKELLDKGTIGRPVVAKIEGRGGWSRPPFRVKQVYLAEMQQMLIYEVGVHCIDTFRYLFGNYGEPKSVYARKHKISPVFAGEDVMIITMNYVDLTCLINESCGSVRTEDIPLPELAIDGTEGTLIYHKDIQVFREDGHKTYEVQQQDFIAAPLQHFVDCLESGGGFETSGEYTVKTMEILWGAYRSAEEGIAEKKRWWTAPPLMEVFS